MADTVDIPTVGPGVAKISSEEVTTLNAGTVAAQQVQRILLALRTADATGVDLPGDGTFGLDVDVTRLPAVALDAPTLAALENITVTVANPGSGQATEATLAAVLAAVDGLEGGIAPLATQVTAAAILAKLSADPASQTTLAAVLAAVDTLELLSTGPDTVYRGVAGVTISLAAGERLHSVLVVPSSGGQVTVTVPGQSADQAPVDFPYAEDFKGGIVGAGNLAIAGAVAYYRVTTFTP